MNDSGSVAVFCSNVYRDKIDQCRANLRVVRENGYISHDFKDSDWRTYQSFVATASPEYPYVSYDIRDDFNLIYSSGTTGLPKGILQSHGARLHWSFSNAIELRYYVDSRALTTTALYSNGTWLAILPVLFAGGTLVILPEFSAKEFLNTVQKEKITHTFMVPTQFIVTLDSPDFDNYDLSSLEAVLCGGSPLRPDTKLEVLKRMTPNLYELYGYSEGFATMNKPGTNQLKPDSVGTPVLGFDVKIVGDDDSEVNTGEVGEIAGYGAGMMSGYHNNPQATEAILWTSPDGRAFIRSGDIGRLDEDGFLYILDRKKDMIISGGFNIFPADIESIVGEHPAVLDVTVIGVPHDKWGETPLALIIPHDGANEDEILTWSNQNLAKHQRLSGVEFRTEFPRNALGKVLKRVLRDEHEKRVS